MVSDLDLDTLLDLADDGGPADPTWPLLRAFLKWWGLL